MNTRSLPKNVWSLDPSKRASGLLSCGSHLCTRKQMNDPRVENVPDSRERGIQTPFCEGCPSFGFPPPSFFDPAMAFSDNRVRPNPPGFALPPPPTSVPPHPWPVLGARAMQPSRGGGKQGFPRIPSDCHLGKIPGKSPEQWIS